MSKILIVDDDIELLQDLARILSTDAFVVELATDGREGLSLVRAFDYDLLIVDWSMPSLTGPELCSAIREMGKNMPILMLTARGAIEDKESGLHRGADDYLTKPFNIREIKARIKALLRRSTPYTHNELRFGNICLQLGAYEVKIREQVLTLAPKEFQLLEFFMRNPKMYFSAEALLNRVWPSDSDSTPAALRQCIKRLRTRLETTESRCTIMSSYGLGYKLDEAANEK